MSHHKQTHNKPLVVLFLLLTVGSGLPVGAFPVIDFDINIKFGQPEQESLILPFAHAVNGSAPVITLSSSTNTTAYLDEGYVELGVNATDVEDGDLTESVFFDLSEFRNELGTYTVYYNVTDSDGHTSYTNRTVTVIENPSVINSTQTQTYFDNAIYQTVEEADPINNVVLGRGESSETIQVGERKFVSSSGLTRWIADSNDNYVERLVTDDVAGVKFESGIFSYYYDKTECGMTVHDIGKIDDNNESFIKYNGWIAKSALNGTDTWTDLEQNNLDCVVSVIDNSEGTKIISVRENSNGKFTETYDIPKPINEMKTTLEFFNNNTALNDHKIAFTNVLDTTPEHYRFLLNQEDIADVYPEDMYDPIEFPQLKGFTTSPATVPISYSQNCNVPTNSTLLDRLEDCVVIIPNGGSVDIPRDDFYVTMYVNATEHPQGLLTDNGFAMDYYSEDKQSWIPVRYEFTNDAMDKLWNVRIVNNQPVENRVFIDYMNINEITAVGETSILDPSVTTPLSEVDIKTVTDNSGTFFGTGTSCTRNPPNLAFTDTFWGQWYAVGGMLGGRYIICTNPMLTFDISSIPDDGSVLQFDFSYDIVSTTFANNLNHRNRWFMGIAEDVRPLTGSDAGRTIFSVTGDTFPENLKFGQFDMTNTGICAGIFPCTMSITLADPTTITDNLELRLESGADWIILTACNYSSNWSSTSANHCGTSIAGSSTRNESWTGDESTILLEITWEIFQPTSAPEQLTCEAVLNNLVLDWSPPTNTGGTPLTGYEIDRSTGGAFQNVAIIPAIPTGWTDISGVIQGVQYSYRVYPVNDLGRGAFAEISCGLAGDPDNPFNLTAQDQALGIVALDWTAPTFTGNTPITGYKIDRTTGTPSTGNSWTYVQHHRVTSGQNPDGSDVYGTDIRILDVGDSTGLYRLQGVTDTTVEGVFLSGHAGGGGAACTHNHYGYPNCTGHSYLFLDFDKEELKNREITWRWDQFKQASGTSLQTFGQWETRAFIADGLYDLTGANTVGGSGSFPADVASPQLEKIHIPSIGNGIIQDCLDTNNHAVVNLGGNPVVATLPNISQMEAANQHEVTCTVDPALIDSQASQDRVTVVFMIYDDQAGSLGCGSNCASSGGGAIVMDYIDISGMGTWDFTNDLPLDTELNLIGASSDPTYPISLDRNPVLNIVTNDFVIGDGFITLVADTGNTLTEYLDTTVEENTNYGYRVFAINSEGISPPSNTAIVFTAGSPSAPNPVAVATGTQSINLSWDIPDLNGGNVISYDIERKTGTGGIYQFLDSITATSYDDGTGLFSLQSATEYCYRVLVTTNVGSSDYSTDACATTFDAPAQVENLTVTAIDGSSVNMSFETPLSDGGSPITGYKVERKIGAGSFVTLDTSTQVQFRNDTGLPIGTLITYRVSASNQFGFGDTASASDTTDATPQVPQNLVCSASTPDSINLSWQTPVTFSPPTGYQISRNIDGGAFSVLVADTASTGTTYNDVTLSLDTIYGYKILAHTSEGDTLLTEPVYCQTLKQPDSPPENFKAEFSQTTPHDVILTWDLPNTFGVPITSITVERDDGLGYVEIAVLPPNAVGMVDTEPDNDVDQKYRIKMSGSLGDSKYGFAIPSDLNRISHFNFEKTISDSGDQKNSATVSGIINFTETGHAGTRAFDYDGASYIIVDVAQESDYDFERTTPFGGSLYYKGSAGGIALDDNWYATNHKFCNLGSGQNGCDYQPFALSTNANGYNAIGTTGGSVPSVNDAYQKRGESILFKTFDKSDLDGKTLHIDWNGFNRGTGAGTCTGIQTVGIYDGEYSIADGGVADFPDGSPIVMKGAGLLQTLNTQSCILGVGGNWSFDGVSATINLSSATDPSNKVTLMFIVQDNDSSNQTNTYAPYFILTDLTLIGTTAINERIWDFTSTLGATYTEDNPTTCIRNCGLTQSTEIGLLGLQALLTKAQTLASIGWAFYLDEGYPVFRMNSATQSIEVKSNQFVTTDNLEHLAFTTNGNSTGAGVEIFVNGTVTGKTIVTDTLISESILNNEPLVIGATSTGTNILQSTTDEVMIFGENLENEEVVEIANDQIETVAPINATITLTGSTFADISSEQPTINLISGFPIPEISGGNLELKNFTTTTVNTASGLSIPASGVLNIPALFNQMGSTSNYTAIATLDNGLEAFVVISNDDLQSPLFTLPAGIEFFFQQQRINDFEDLSFNFTKTSIPFDLACNLKSELFEDGITYEFENVGFLQEIFDVPRNKDVVVACIDQNSPLLNPDEPSFGGSNALLTFVSFGDTTGIGAFLNFTDNYGDFFGAPLPYLFIILAAALFTGRSAPTGIIVIGIALGIMWYLGILVIDPVLWGIIVVLVILGAIGGKKFL